MIISYKNNYIFLHSRKTAGSTISVALAQTLGPSDIMVGTWEDALNYGVNLNERSQKILKEQLIFYWPKLLPPYLLGQRDQFFPPHAVNGAVRKYLSKKYNLSGAHADAKSVAAFTDEFWHNAFKFAFVRNPWEHAVSDYNWRLHLRKTQISFKEFLYRVADLKRDDPEKIRPPVITNWPIYTIDDQIVVDRVCFYENLHSELENIRQKTGVAIDLQQINAKANIKPNKNVSSYYDEECIEIVRRVYHKEIKEFNYNIPF